MIVQAACQAPASQALRTESLGRPKCSRCGSVMLVAEASRFSAGGRVEHDWSCDKCGNAFVTSIRVSRR
jgi:hypothetical protein